MTLQGGMADDVRSDPEPESRGGRDESSPCARVGHLTDDQLGLRALGSPEELGASMLTHDGRMLERGHRIGKDGHDRRCVGLVVP